MTVLSSITSLILSLLFVPILVSAQAFSKPLWTAQNIWDADWEREYAKWVSENATPEYFMKYNIATDCADVIYGFRFIFARENKLPFVVGLGEEGAYFTHETVLKQWEDLPTDPNWFNDKKFLAALNYVLNYTYTGTLRRDSYPFKLDKQNLVPGAFFFELPAAGPQIAGSNHVVLVKNINTEDPSTLPIRIISSFVPKQVRFLTESSFIYPEQPRATSGFRRFLWPKQNNTSWSLMQPHEMPGFSDEQSQPDFMGDDTNFTFALIKRISPGVSPALVVTEGIEQIRLQLNIRQQIVRTGFQVCSQEPCKVNSTNYQHYSTNTRDAKIKKLFEQTSKVTAELIQNNSDLNDIWFRALNSPALKIDGVEYSLKSIMFAWSIGSYSSEPNVKPEERWGITASAIHNSLATRGEKTISNKLVGLCENLPENECHKFQGLLGRTGYERN